jgi:hypothetical protein
MIHFLVFWVVKANFSLSQVDSSVETVVLVLSIGGVVGLFKSLFVSAFAFFAPPRSRWWLIIGSTVVLSLPEAWFYYRFYIFMASPLPFG